MDPIAKLAAKINAIKKAREELGRKVEADEKAISQTQHKLDQLRKEQKAKEEFAQESDSKGERVAKLVAETEKALKKIIETALVLEKVLDAEKPLSAY